jgi:hypothetical protein
MTEFYKEREARDLSYVELTPMWPLVTYGIVNPYGPTLMGFGIIVHEEEDFTELAYYSLNPFQQEVLALGVFNVGVDPAEIIKASLGYFGISVGGTPTLVLPPQLLPDGEIKSFFRVLLAQVDDVLGTIELCRQFIGNPWDRVSEETKRATDTLVGNNGGKAPRKHTDADVDELLDIIWSEQHFMEELKAFGFAWNGSIDFQNSNGNSGLAETALSYERFTAILLKLLGGGPKTA